MSQERTLIIFTLIMCICESRMGGMGMYVNMSETSHGARGIKSPVIDIAKTGH